LPCRPGWAGRKTRLDPDPPVRARARPNADVRGDSSREGILDIESASQAANALRPIAGPGAALLFAAGIVGTGLLAVPALAGSAAYAVSGVAGWRSSLAEPPQRAVGFYSTLALATLLGATITLTPVNPMKALYWSAVVNGIVAGPPLWLKVLGWMSAGLMYASVFLDCLERRMISPA
jgi:Mn2+/Fe2+ NRAMP family transporter